MTPTETVKQFVNCIVRDFIRKRIQRLSGNLSMKGNNAVNTDHTEGVLVKLNFTGKNPRVVINRNPRKDFDFDEGVVINIETNTEGDPFKIKKPRKRFDKMNVRTFDDWKSAIRVVHRGTPSWLWGKLYHKLGCYNDFMKKMLILSRFVKEYEPKRLVEEGRKVGLAVDLIKYGQVNLGVVGGKYKSDLGEYDLVIPRAASKKGSSMVGIKEVLLRELKGKKILNGVSFEKFPLLGKMEQGVMLAKADLPTVDFLTFGSKLGWREFKKTPVFNFPLIIKGRFGSHGRAVKLVNSWEEFDKIFQKYSAGEVLVQPKLTVKQWYRSIVVGETYLGEMRHRQKEKYGGEEGTLVKLNSTKMDRLKEICLKAAKLFECDYAGIDVVWDEAANDFKILEVNRTAQFKYFEKRTGINVAGKMVKHLLSE